MAHTSASDSAFGGHCALQRIFFTYLLTYLLIKDEKTSVHDTDAEYKHDEDDQHDTKQRQIEDTAIGLHPATVHGTTQHPQHPVVDVDSYSDE